MESTDQTPELEKILLENQKLKRELELNYEQQRLDIERRKIEEESDRHHRDYKRNLTSTILTAFSILVTAIITIITFVSTRSTNDATNRINEETLLLTRLERIDKLKSEFDDSLASPEHKSSLAFELIRDSQLLSEYDKERLIRYYHSFVQLEKTRKEIRSKQENLNPKDIVNLKRAELNQIILENQLNTEQDEDKRNKIRKKLQSINQEMGVTEESRTIARQLDTLGMLQKEITGNNRNSPLINEQVTWLKEGYYRTLGDVVVTLEKLNEGQGTGVLTLTGPSINSRKQNIYFSVPGSLTTTYNGKKLFFRFIRIDHAGKNPLTKALYFTSITVGYDKELVTENQKSITPDKQTKAVIEKNTKTGKR